MITGKLVSSETVICPNALGDYKRSEVMSKVVQLVDVKALRHFGSHQIDVVKALMERRDCTGKDIETFLQEDGFDYLFANDAIDIFKMLLCGLYDKTQSLSRVVMALKASHSPNLIRWLNIGNRNLVLNDYPFFKDAAQKMAPKEMVDTVVALIRSATTNGCEEEDRNSLTWAYELLAEVKFENGTAVHTAHLALRIAVVACIAEYSCLEVAQKEHLLLIAEHLHELLAEESQ